MSFSFGRSTLWLAFAFFGALCSVVNAQLNIIHQEGFNDDGVAAGRYEMKGRGQLIGADGPGAWEHSFLVDAIGLTDKSPEKRAALLWTDAAEEADFTDASRQVWENLIDFMLDGKENATVGFVPGSTSITGDFLAFGLLEENGHTVMDIEAELPDPADVDLIIHTSQALPPSPTDFVDYPVPVITYNGENHDDTAIASIGIPTTGGPTMIDIVEANKDHPVLAGVDGPSVQWLDDFLADEPLQGIGGALPAGSTVLATYVDPETSLVLPAILLVDEGADLLGAFAPVPEGEGYIIGGDLNLDFEEGDGPGSETNPVSLTLNPIDVSGESGVKLSVDLAATTVDFEPVDFVRVSYASDENAEPEDFVVLGQFNGLDDSSSPNNKSLVDPDLGALNADEFTTFTFDIPDDVDELVVKFEAFSTFPNEVLGVDNVVVFTGEALPGLVGDIDGDGMVAFADFLILSTNFGMPGGPAEGDIDGDGQIAFADFLALSTNFGMSAAAAPVPEPSCVTLIGLAALFVGLARRRRR